MARVKTWGYGKTVLVSVATCASALIFSGAPLAAESQHSTVDIQVHAGAPGGAYSQLVEQLDERAEALRLKTDAGEQHCENEASCMAAFSFKVACMNGGSINNLVRLGMQKNERSAETEDACEYDAANRFALVQDFYAYAATSDCGDNDFWLTKFLRSLFFRTGAQKCRQEKEKAFPGNDAGSASSASKPVYAQFRDLRTVVPMYYGRIQLVAADPEIQDMEQLAGRTIYVGNGVNNVHGREVLNHHPKLTQDSRTEILQQEAAMQRVAEILDCADCTIPRGQKDLGNLLLACGVAQAYVISGELISIGEIADPDPLIAKCTDKPLSLRQIPIPEVIVAVMVDEFPYYQKVQAPRSLVKANFRHSMPAVTTYLVTNSQTDEALVRNLTSALYNDWHNLMLLNDDLVRLEENIYKQPAKLHDGARRALQDVGVMGKDLVPWWAALAGIVTLLALFWKTEVRYNRLGEKHSGGIGQYLSRMVLILFGTIMLFMLVVKGIRALEGIQAFDFGTENPIANKGFDEVLLWMFTFVSSGYENNVFPSSPYSIFVVGLFAIFGIALPIWAIVKVIDNMREGKLARERGGEHRSWLKRKIDRTGTLLNIGYRSKGMLLLCGWNSKAPGIVYSLTCPDSPYPGVVNIVADMDIEYPIQHWHFNKQRVRFYRGDASHRGTLERAEGLRANIALILADHHPESSANSAGVLTALALEKLQEKGRRKPLFIAAEMTLREEDLRFSSAHINEIVDPRLINQRMLAVACFNKHVQNFVLDILSPDNYAEWYAMDAEVLRERFLGKQENPTAGEFCSVLAQHEIAAIGVCAKSERKSNSLFSPDFEMGSTLDPLLTIDSLRRPLHPGSYIVCAAMNPQSFNRPWISRSAGTLPVAQDAKFENLSIVTPPPAGARILVIGLGESANSLANYLRESYSGVDVHTLAIDASDGLERHQEISKRVAEKNWTHVILLTSIRESYDSTEFSRVSRHLDSKTILRANLVKSVLGDHASKVDIIAEVNNTHSRRLAEDAGVTTVVPSSLVVERILARLVSGRGYVSNLVSAMLSPKDGVYLRSVLLDGDHPLVGRRFGDLLNRRFADGRVLGFLPQDKQQMYNNENDDFGTHFAMCPTRHESDLELKAGDTLIILNYPSTSASQAPAA